MDKGMDTKLNDREELLHATDQAERVLLGAILIMAVDRKEINEVRQILDTSDFRYEGNRRIYRAMLECDAPPNQIVVAEQLAQSNTLEGGDCAEMCFMIAECPCALDYMHYAHAVKTYADHRSGRPKQPRGIEL